MTLVAPAVAAIAIPRILCIPTVSRIIPRTTGCAVDLDPVMDAGFILPVRLPPTALQIAGMYYNCDEANKKDEAGKDDRPILARSRSEHYAVSKWVSFDV